MTEVVLPPVQNSEKGRVAHRCAIVATIAPNNMERQANRDGWPHLSTLALAEWS